MCRQIHRLRLIVLSSPGPKPLSPKPKNLKPRGLGLTLKSHGTHTTKPHHSQPPNPTPPPNYNTTPHQPTTPHPKCVSPQPTPAHHPTPPHHIQWEHHQSCFFSKASQIYEWLICHKVGKRRSAVLFYSMDHIFYKMCSVSKSFSMKTSPGHSLDFISILLEK